MVSGVLEEPWAERLQRGAAALVFGMLEELSVALVQLPLCFSPAAVALLER